MKKNMLIRIFAVICVLACLFAFVSCHDDINATIEENKNTAANDLAKAKEELNAAIAAVKKTADAAALKTDLNSALARIEAAEGDLAATKAALEAAKADLEATKSTLTDLNTEVDAAIAAINEAIAGCAAKADLEALSAKVNTNTADIAEIEAAIADLASKTEVAEIKTALEALINANTTDIATIKATLETLATKEYVDGVKKELSDSITALETKLAADIETNTKAIEALKTDVDNLKKIIGDIDLDELVKKIALVEEMLKKIDIYGAFEKDYGAMTDKLLDKDYAYAYVKFVEIVLEMTDGPYEPSVIKGAKLDAEAILFEVTRATSEDGLKALYEELVAIKNGLKTLEESLTEMLANITYVNTSKENIDAINAAKKVYDRIIELEIELKNPELKTRFERIWNANIELNGDGTIANPGLKNDAYTSIDKAIATLVGRDVKLGSNDKDVIDNYQAAIVALKTAIDNSEYRDLYEPGLADGVIDATKAEVLAETIATLKADYAVSKADAIKTELIEAYIGTATEGAWADAVVALIAADLKAANAELSDEAALTQAAEAYAADASAYADKLDAAKANAQAKANEQDFSAEIAAKVAELAEADANTYVASDEGAQDIFVRAMAESLYNEDAAEAIALRYDNMVKAAAEAVAHVGTVAGIINTWNTTGLLWNDAQAIDAINAINAWVANASYKSTNDAYIAAYEFVNANISDENRDYVYGIYNGAVTNFAQLNNVANYVAAMLNIFNNGFDVMENEEVKLTVPGNEELIAAIKNAVNTIEVEGKQVLDVDNTNFDKVVGYLAALEAELKTEACGANAVAAKLNYETMISEIIRNRIVVINNARTTLAGIIDNIKRLYYINDAWIVTDINAADTINAFRNQINAVYDTVELDNKPDYNVITDTVTSSLAEDAIKNAYNAFEAFTADAVKAFKAAEKLIADIEKLGAVKLDFGKRIYQVLKDIEVSKATISGLKNTTNFSFYDEELGEYRTVNFLMLEARLQKLQVEYADLAALAVAKAAELKTAIEDLVATVGNDANKLDYYNAIIAMLNRVNDEWLEAFYSNTMFAKDNKTATVIDAIKAANTATDKTTIIGTENDTYVFLVNDTFNKLATMVNTAVATYAKAEAWAKTWKTNALNMYKDGYSYHDYDIANTTIDFKGLEEDYLAQIKVYYNVSALTADTDPDFDLFDKHNEFYAAYKLCKEAHENAVAEIGKIELAIIELGNKDTIELTNTVAKRKALNDIYAAISNFETNFCDKAQTDGDIKATLLDDLAKHEYILQIAEYYVLRAGEVPSGSDFNAEASLGRAISSIDAVYSAVNGDEVKMAEFVQRYKDIIDEAIGA